MEEAKIVGYDLSERRLQGAEFEDVVFRECQLANATLLECRFTTCKFVDCDLSSVDLSGSLLNGVQFEQCRLLGVDFTPLNPMLMDLGFRESLLDYCIFERMPLTRTRFIDCRMRGADLSHARLERAVFTGSDLQGARFDHAVLLQTDLRGAQNVSFDPKSVRLGRTRIDLETLLALGDRLGLETELGSYTR